MGKLDRSKTLRVRDSIIIVMKAKKYKTMKDFIDDKSTNPKYQWSGRDFLRI